MRNITQNYPIIVVILLIVFGTNVYANKPHLKLVCPDGVRDSVQDKMTGEWEYYEHRNPDSIMVDTCQDSPTFGQFYAKKTFELFFNFDNYPLNTILDTNELLNISQAQFSKQEFQTQFQALENKFGTIYFKGLARKYHDSTYKYSPEVYLQFANYQNIDTVISYFENTIDSLKFISYNNRSTVIAVPVSIFDNEHNVFRVYPNPANIAITIETEKLLSTDLIVILSMDGQVIKSSPYKSEIDVSDLPIGVYFIKYGKQFTKFIKE